MILSQQNYLVCLCTHRSFFSRFHTLTEKYINANNNKNISLLLRNQNKNNKTITFIRQNCTENSVVHDFVFVRSLEMLLQIWIVDKSFGTFGTKNKLNLYLVCSQMSFVATLTTKWFVALLTRNLIHTTKIAFDNKMFELNGAAKQSNRSDNNIWFFQNNLHACLQNFVDATEILWTSYVPTEIAFVYASNCHPQMRKIKNMKVIGLFILLLLFRSIISTAFYILLLSVYKYMLVWWLILFVLPFTHTHTYHIRETYTLVVSLWSIYIRKSFCMSAFFDL